MARISSKFAFTAATAAALSLAASPAEARSLGGHRHHGGISFGDVLTGGLILGGIALVASAASKSDKHPDRYDDPPPPAPEYRDGYDYRAPPPPSRGGYDYRASPPQSRGGYDYAPPRRDYQAGGINDAVNVCVDQVERGDSHVSAVDNVARTADGWNVSGQVSAGGGFTCSIDNDGRVRRIDMGGNRYSSSSADPQDGQWSDDQYSRAREQADSGAYDDADGDYAYSGS